MESTSKVIKTLLLVVAISLISSGVLAGDIVHRDDKAPTRPCCDNNFVLVKVPTWIDDKDEDEFEGVGARFGPTLESKERNDDKNRIALADPPDCCIKPKNKVSFRLILLSLSLYIYIYFKTQQSLLLLSVTYW